MVDLRDPTQFLRPPERVVSLVPSLTESLIDLGAGEYLVGVTDFCVHPGHIVADLPKVGGTKDPRVDSILDLNPHLVIANREENTPQTVAALRSVGIPVWVTFPQTVQQVIDDLWTIAKVFRLSRANLQLKTLQSMVEWAHAAAMDRPTVMYFCPIWMDQTPSGHTWWMTFNEQTYASDLLRHLGGSNVFGARQRQYPMTADLNLTESVDSQDRDTRYPRVTIEELRRSKADLILLPDEPFPFEDNHLTQLQVLLPDLPAVHNQRVHLVDGSLITWHGTRMAKAIQALEPYFSEIQTN